MQKILLYYKFTPVKDPEMLKLWQKTLCDSLNLRGRILVSTQGINGTVGGELDDLKAYVKATKQFPGFKDIVWKWSDGGRGEEISPRMSVKVKKELVAFETWDEIAIDEHGVVGTGPHLKPHEVNELVENLATMSCSSTDATNTRPRSVVSKMPSYQTRGRRVISNVS